MSAVSADLVLGDQAIARWQAHIGEVVSQGAEVLLPADNEPNAVADLTPDILGDIKITYVRTLDEVLEHALQKDPVTPPIAPEPKQKGVGPDSPRAIH